MDKEVQEIKGELEKGTYLLEELNKMEGLSYITPEGAFYLFINIAGFGLVRWSFPGGCWKKRPGYCARISLRSLRRGLYKNFLCNLATRDRKRGFALRFSLRFNINKRYSASQRHSAGEVLSDLRHHVLLPVQQRFIM